MSLLCNGEVVSTRPVEEPADCDPSDVVALPYSSGTTGLPKAVRHTRTSLRHATRHWSTAP